VSRPIVIVGAGAIGATIAYELALGGHRVLLLDREAGVGLGCSAGTAGLIAPSHAGTLATPRALREGIAWMTKHESPFYIRPRLQIVPWLVRFARAALSREQVSRANGLLRRLSRDSLDLHTELVGRGLPTSLERRGVLYTYETEAGFEHARAQIPRASELDLHLSALTVAQAQELEPVVAGSIVGAVYSQEEGHLDSLQYVQAVAAAAVAAGADVRLRTEVLGFRATGGRIVELETTTGAVEVETVVLAAGVWSRDLGRQLGLTIPLEGAKGYSVELEASERDPRIPIYMHESRVIATPYPDRLRLAGTLELAGADYSVDKVRLGTLQKAAARNLRGVQERRMLGIWRGFRPTPPDGMPLLGRPSRFRNLVVATGHAMTGVALAPVMAQLARELVEGSTASYDLSLMDPDRFA
jgi:D-amino-acid dehydrogenase